MNQHFAVVPFSRRGKNFEGDAKEEEPGCSRRESGTGPHLPRKCAREQAKLMRMVKIQVNCAAVHPGQDCRFPSVVTHSRLWRATSVRFRVGIVFEDGSGVAIDWVTSRSYSSARRRLDVQSGQRKGRKGAAPSMIVVTEKVMRMGPLQERC